MKYRKLFILIIIMILFLCGCRSKDLLESTHYIFNDEIDPYFIVTGTPHNILDFEGNKEKINSYTIKLNIETLVTEQLKELKLKVMSSNVINEEQLLYDSTNKSGTNTPYSKTIVNNVTVGGNGYSKIFGDIYYNFKGEKKLEFNENIILININDKDLNMFTDNINSDLINLVINTTDNGEYYSTSISINFKDTGKHHLDLQSWLIGSKFEVYSFSGIYNYYLNNNISNLNNKIYKDIDFEYLYIRANYWDKDEQLTKIYYRISKENLLKL